MALIKGDSLSLCKDFDKKSFGKDVLITSFGQVILMSCGIIQSILLPKYLTQTDYGYVQLFLLYGGYGGLLHLGFIDGLLVRWSGKNLKVIGNEIKPAIYFLILEQFGITALIGVICYFAFDDNLFKENIYVILIYIMILNIFTFFVFLDQSIKQFLHLTFINVNKNIIALTLIIILLYIGLLNYHSAIIAIILSIIMIIICYLFTYSNYVFNHVKMSRQLIWKCGAKNVSIGLFILAGNFIFTLSTSFDRLLISRLFPIEQFAIYSLAVTLISILYMFIGTISQVLFPYICEVEDNVRVDVYRLAKSGLIISWAFLIGLAYLPLIVVLKYYLPQYMESLPIIKILFCSVCFVSIIQILHMNYFKLYGRQRIFFILSMIALVVLISLSMILIRIRWETTSIAFASIIGFAIWCMINELCLKSLIENTIANIFKDLLAIFCYAIAFWLQFYIPTSSVGQSFFYIFSAICVTFIFLRRESMELINKLSLKG